MVKKDSSSLGILSPNADDIRFKYEEMISTTDLGPPIVGLSLGRYLELEDGRQRNLTQ